jgi:hypothetical protein
MDVLLGEGNQISDFGKDVLLGEGKKIRFRFGQYGLLKALALARIA